MTQQNVQQQVDNRQSNTGIPVDRHGTILTEQDDGRTDGRREEFRPDSSQGGSRDSKTGGEVEREVLREVGLVRSEYFRRKVLRSERREVSTPSQVEQVIGIEENLVRADAVTGDARQWVSGVGVCQQDDTSLSVQVRHVNDELLVVRYECVFAWRRHGGQRASCGVHFRAAQ